MQEYLLFPEVLRETDECVIKKVVYVETASQAKAEPSLSTDLCSK